jgi:hypothetical protein
VFSNVVLRDLSMLILWINLDASMWTKLNWIDKLMSYDTISEIIVQCVLKSRCWYVGQSSFLKRAHERAWGHSSNQRFTNSNHFGITSEFWSIRHCIEVKDFHFSSSRSFVWKKKYHVLSKDYVVHTVQRCTYTIESSDL